MTYSHDHPDKETLHVACPACIEKVRQDQRAAGIAAAPMRRCTWTCGYSLPGDDEWMTRTLSFSLVVRVPAGWDGDDVDNEYAPLTGEAFVMALPDSVLMEWTDVAAASMDVERVVIGSIVPDVARPAPAAEPSLFEVAS